jgi:hypothetical protein
MLSTYFDATDWQYSFSLDQQTQAWQHSRQQITAWAKWNAYINQICRDAYLAALHSEDIAASSSNHDSIWSLVNGSVITVGQTRIALIPTEAIDQSELEIPQEWVDIPNWAVDYYLAIYLASDLESFEIAGYATHQQIKQQGQLNHNDRTYRFAVEALTTDLNLLWLTYDRYTMAQTRAAIAPIAELSPQQAQNLIQRLGDATELWPRLEVPFASWAALLSNPTWQQQLYQQRQGITNPVANTVNRLAGWVQGQFDQLWQPAETTLAPQQIAIATRGNRGDSSDRIARVKVLNLNQGQIALLVSLVPLGETEVRVELQVHPTGDSIYLPGETKLRLLTPDGTDIAEAKATVTETIRLQFRANYGESFQVEMTCGEEVVLEQFEL